MRIKSLRSRIITLLFFLGVPAFFIVCNLYMEKHQDHYTHILYDLEHAERSLLELVVTESKALSSPSKIKNLQADYQDIAKSLNQHAASVSSLLLQRDDLLQKLAQTTQQSTLFFQETEKRLLDLTSSVRYIHEHHLAYLKNFMRRGRMEADYGKVDTFIRDDKESASEVEIIRAAVSIHNTVLDLLRFFQQIRQNPLMDDAEQVFQNKVHAFFHAVNVFEDYSLDAQDGLLVEELLISGRSFEKDFTKAMQSGAQAIFLTGRLSENLTETLSGIHNLRTQFQKDHARNRTWVVSVQIISLVLTFLALGAIAFNAFGILKQLRSIVRETQKIQGNLSHRIPVNKALPKEFEGVFSALNNMALRIQKHVVELETTKLELEHRVDERTKDLANKELKYRTLLDNQSDAVFLYPLTKNGFGCFREVNEVAVKRYGYSRDEFNTLVPEDLSQPESAESCKQDEIKRALKEHGHAFFETVQVKKNGEVFAVEINAKVINLENQNYVLSTARDISDRKIIEAQIKRFSRVVEQSLNEVYIFDTKTLRFKDVNRGARKNLGYTLDELRQMTAVDIKPEMTRKKFEQLVAPLLNGDEEQVVFHTVHCRKDGSTYPVEVHLELLPEQPPLFVAIIMDISKRKEEERLRVELEGQLRQKYKMEAVGGLAGGIAHDFNNLLSIIIGNTELLKRKLNSGGDPAKHITNITDATGRATEMISQILAFSRSAEPQLKNIDFKELVANTMTLLRSTIPSTVEIRSCLPNFPVWIKGDKTQLQQVLINLCTNAVHAMDERGRLDISLELSVLPEKLKVDPGNNISDYAVLAVRDTGSGMDQETISKIFDPFFTTKEVDKGTGMGLSMVHGIISQHGGLISVDSKPLIGSEFSVYLPVADVLNLESEDRPWVKALPAGDEKILLVDDERALIDTTEELLRELGYDVVSVTCSEEALELFRQRSTEFDLVITDQTMPKFSGDVLAAKILEIEPDIPIILASGYSSKITDEDIRKIGVYEYLRKPLSGEILAKAVRDALDHRKKGI